jgi:hypothetical protein
MSKVDFFIIGAPKSGTTSLFYYLKQHPDIYLPEKKELHYFSREYLKRAISGPGDKYVVDEVPTDAIQYDSNYDMAGKSQLCGDVSPSYLYHFATAEKIKKYNNDAKIIIILRDHVSKSYSQYMHLCGSGREMLSFEQALVHEEERKKKGFSDFWLYVESTRYCPGVQHYLRVFGADKVKIFLFDELMNDRRGVLYELCRFIGVDTEFTFEAEDIHNVSGEVRSRLFAKWFLSPNWFTSFLRRFIPSSLGAPIRAFLRNKNTGSKLTLNACTREKLTMLFSDDRKCLENILGRVLPWS